MGAALYRGVRKRRRQQAEGVLGGREAEPEEGDSFALWNTPRPIPYAVGLRGGLSPLRTGLRPWLVRWAGDGVVAGCIAP